MKNIKCKTESEATIMIQQKNYMDKLTDIRRVIAKFNQLPEKAQSYVVGYVEGRAETQEYPAARDSV